MEIETQTIRELQTPYKMIYKNEIYELLKFDRKFVIKGFKVKTVNGKIDSVYINSPHPNAKPRTGEFCIPHKLRQLELNENTLTMIKSMLCCFNLDDCYFTPWSEIEYRKQEVNGAWQTKMKR